MSPQVNQLCAVMQNYLPWHKARVKFTAAFILSLITLSYEGVAFPICWHLLSKRGNSNTEECIKLMEQVLTRIHRCDIGMVVADREFIGKEWFRWLHTQNIPFAIRVKAGRYIVPYLSCPSRPSWILHLNYLILEFLRVQLSPQADLFFSASPPDKTTTTQEQPISVRTHSTTTDCEPQH